MDWFVMIDGEERGPMSAVVLGRHFAAGEIDGESYVWRDGFDEWLPAFLVEELAPIFEKKPSAIRRPPPPPAAAKTKRIAPIAAPASAPPRVREELLEIDFSDLPPASLKAAPRVDITEPEGIVSPAAGPRFGGAAAPGAPKRNSVPNREEDDRDAKGPWENPTNVEPLPLGERVHQENIASSLFTDPGAKIKVGSTGSFALDIVAWDAAALKAKAAAAAAAAKESAAVPGPALSLARPQPGPKPISSAGVAKQPTTALRQPLPEPKRGAPIAWLVGGGLLIALLAGALFLAMR